MKKLLTTLFLLLASFTFAQNTSVTGQITDAGGQSWNNGTFSFTFVGPQNVIWTGGTLNPNAPITGLLSASGAIPATNIPDNNQITPASTQWLVRVCSATLPQTCFSNTLTITGASQTVNLTPGAIKFLVPTVPSVISPISAYADAEISGGWIGFQYFNLVSSAPKACTVVTLLSCSTFVTVGSGSSTVSPNNGSAGAVAFYAAAGGSTTVSPNTGLTSPSTGTLNLGSVGVGGTLTIFGTVSGSNTFTAAGNGTELDTTAATYHIGGTGSFGCASGTCSYSSASQLILLPGVDVQLASGNLALTGGKGQHFKTQAAQADSWGVATCASSTVTVTFTIAYTSTPAIVVSDETTVGGARVSAKSNTAFTVTCTGATDVVDYFTGGNPN